MGTTGERGQSWLKKTTTDIADNEELQVIWVGQSASPQLLLDLFGVDDIFKVDIRIVRGPSPFSTDQTILLTHPPPTNAVFPRAW